MLVSPWIAYNRHNVFIIMSTLLFGLSDPRNKIHTSSSMYSLRQLL